MDVHVVEAIKGFLFFQPIYHRGLAFDARVEKGVIMVSAPVHSNGLVDAATIIVHLL